MPARQKEGTMGLSLADELAGAFGSEGDGGGQGSSGGGVGGGGVGGVGGVGGGDTSLDEFEYDQEYLEDDSLRSRVHGGGAVFGDLDNYGNGSGIGQELRSSSGLHSVLDFDHDRITIYNNPERNSDLDHVEPQYQDHDYFQDHDHLEQENHLEEQYDYHHQEQEQEQYRDISLKEHHPNQSIDLNNDQEPTLSQNKHEPTFFSPRVHEDPLSLLRSHLENTRRFLVHLRSDEREQEVEDALVAYLNLLRESERVREDQIQQFEFGLGSGFGIGVRGGEEGGEIPRVILPSETTLDPSSPVSPSPSSISPSNTYESIRQHTSLPPRSIPYRSSIPLGPTSHTSTHFSPPSILPISATTSTSASSIPVATPTSSSSSISDSISSLRQNTTLLLTVLSNLQSSSMALSSGSGTSRSLRGIKASIDSFREREAMEVRARKIVDEWEARRLRAGLGLSGKSGGMGGSRVVLQDECKAFKSVLDDCQRRFEDIMHRPHVEVV